MPKAGREVLFKTSRMDFKDLYDDLHRLTPATGLSRIVDVLEENNTVYGVEESEKGMTLTHYLSLKSRPLTPAEARTLLQPVMEGVALLHKSGLIHRGICPDNILLPIDGAAMLTGYGTLALRTGGSELKSQLYAGYAAPEQYSAAEFSGRYTDVYALAAVTYRLVTGQTPVSAPQRRVPDSLESAHSLEPGVPTYFSQVISCAMRLDPAKRMQTVPELMSALANPSVASAMFDTGETQVSTKKILGAAMVVIVVLAVLLLWAVLGPMVGGDDAGADSSASDGSSSTALPTVSPEEDLRLIPSFVGQNFNEIRTSELYAQYRFVPTEEYSSEYAEGVIMSQTPAGGTPQTEETPVIEITVSLGENRIIMPDIIDYTEENAKARLDTYDILYSMVELEYDGSYTADQVGTVVRCSVEPGEEFDASEPIVVWIAGDIPAEPDSSDGTAGSAAPSGEG